MFIRLFIEFLVLFVLFADVVVTVVVDDGDDEEEEEEEDDSNALLKLLPFKLDANDELNWHSFSAAAAVLFRAFSFNESFVRIELFKFEFGINFV